MSANNNDDHQSDGRADAVAATAIIALVVYATYLWLSGMPS
jgi:hypothetical protein